MDLQLINVERDKDFLQQKLGQVEQEIQISLKNEQLLHEEDVERLQKEKVCGNQATAA